MGAMVRRDRSFTSVIIWSFCNEIECHQDQPGDNRTAVSFRNIAKFYDPTRPVSCNWVDVETQIIDQSLDVHGIRLEERERERERGVIISSYFCLLSFPHATAIMTIILTINTINNILICQS